MRRPVWVLLGLLATASSTWGQDPSPIDPAQRLTSGPEFRGASGAGFRPAGQTGRALRSATPGGIRSILSASRGDPLLSLGGAAPRLTSRGLNPQRLRAQQQQRRQLVQRTARPQTAQRRARHQVAHQLTLGFTVEADAERRAEQDRLLAHRLREIEQRLGAKGLEVRHEGDAAIVTGTVSNDEQRRVIQAYLQLEPGVHRVVDRLQKR